MADTTYDFEEVEPILMEDCSYTVGCHIPSESWVSFYDWLPDYHFTTRNKFYSIHEGRLYVNHVEGYDNLFYGVLYESSLSPVLVSPKELMDKRVPFTTNAVLVNGSLPMKSWLFNKYQTSDITVWRPKDPNLSLVDNYGFANCYFMDGVWQFNDFRNTKLEEDFIVSRLDLLNLDIDKTQAVSFSNRLVGDHLVIKLTFGQSNWYFTDIGYNVTFEL